MTVFDLPHIQEPVQVGTSGIYRVYTEEGYWLHKPSFGENIWKTATLVYPNEDLTLIQIVAEADLPEGAELCGDVTNPPEVM